MLSSSSSLVLSFVPLFLVLFILISPSLSDSVISLQITTQEWQSLAKRAEAAGASALELNLCCRHGLLEKGMKLDAGGLQDAVQDVSE